MAQIDIGKLSIGPHKGDYNNSTAYVANDIVYYNGSAYIAKQSTTGNLPTDTNNWNTFSAGSGGIWNSGLSLGSAGQVVKVNSGASALEFGTISSPIKKTYFKMFRGGQSISGFNVTSPSEVSNYNLSITPTSSSSVFIATYSVGIGSHSDHSMMQAVAKIGSGSYTKLGTGKASFYNTEGYYDFGSFHVGGDGNQVKVASHQFYYAPATTSTITFALFCGQHSSTAYFGRSTQNTTDDYTALGMSLRVDEYSSSSDLSYSEHTSG